MKPSVSVIIPTTGNGVVIDAIESVLRQTYKNLNCTVVVDGDKFSENANALLYPLRDSIDLINLKKNTGANGRNGHQIFSAFSFLVDTDYIVYLDQDCYFDPTHIESMIELILDKQLDWCYSLRKIVSREGSYICNDDCESLGKYKPIFDYHLIDTNCYCIRRDLAVMVSPYFIGSHGHDRRYCNVLLENFPNFDCTGKYTVNYRLGGDNNLTGEFFQYHNELVDQKYNGALPWQK